MDGRPLDLSAKEFSLLELLALQRGKTFSRTEIADRLYDEESDRDSNVIDVFVARLRRKLDDAGLAGAEVMGGLVTSTLLTLLVIPTLHALFAGRLETSAGA